MIRRCTRSATRKRARQRNTRTNMALYYRGAQEGHREHKDSPYVDMCGVDDVERGDDVFREKHTSLGPKSQQPLFLVLRWDQDPR